MSSLDGTTVYLQIHPSHVVGVLRVDTAKVMEIFAALLELRPVDELPDNEWQELRKAAGLVETAMLIEAVDLNRTLLVVAQEALKTCRLPRPHPLSAADAAEAQRIYERFVRCGVLPAVEEWMQMVRQAAGGKRGPRPRIYTDDDVQRVVDLLARYEPEIRNYRRMARDRDLEGAERHEQGARLIRGLLTKEPSREDFDRLQKHLAGGRPWQVADGLVAVEMGISARRVKTLRQRHRRQAIGDGKRRPKPQ